MILLNTKEQSAGVKTLTFLPAREREDPAVADREVHKDF
jgi:hypothetical protein